MLYLRIISISILIFMSLCDESSDESWSPFPSRSNSRKRARSQSQEGPLNAEESKPTKKWTRPPGYIKIESQRNRKIVHLLKTKNNGVSNFLTAKKETNKYIAEQRKKNRLLKKEKHQEFRKTNPPKHYKPKPPGYGGREATIERTMRTILRQNEDLPKEKVRKMAEKKWRNEVERKNQATKARKALKAEKKENQD